MPFSPPQYFKISQLVRSWLEYIFRYARLFLTGLVSVLVITFLHNFAFNSGTFYLALYYQVCFPFLLLPRYAC